MCCCWVCMLFSVEYYHAASRWCIQHRTQSTQKPRIPFPRNKLISNKYVNEKKYITEIYLFFLFVWCGSSRSSSSSIPENSTNDSGCDGGDCCVLQIVCILFFFQPLASMCGFFPKMREHVWLRMCERASHNHKVFSTKHIVCVCVMCAPETNIPIILLCIT